MKAPVVTVAQLIEILGGHPPDLPVFLDVGFGPSPVKGFAFETRLMSDDRLEGGPPLPEECPDGLRVLVIV